MQSGLVIADRYELEQPLGEGAMGAVWRARHLTLGTAVAVKVIRREAALNKDALKRFEREAVLAARIRSAHVVQVLDHGHHDGLPYIVMEYLSGVSLRDRLLQRGRLGLAETALMVRHVCRALAQAHGVGLVHRDIKPENIFVSPGEEEGEEVIKVLDFGVAKVTDELGLAGVAPTQTGALLGTPFYVSPEQARGLKLVGPPADMWSLGVVTFECLTGQRPFEAHAMGPLMAKIIHGPIPVPSQVCAAAAIPPAVDGWVARALCREPDGRFASAREMSKTFAAAAQLATAPSLTSSTGWVHSADASATMLLDSSSGEFGPPIPAESADLAKTAVLPDTGATMAFPEALPVPAAPGPPSARASGAAERSKLPSNESLIARPWPDAIVIPQKSRAPLLVAVGLGALALLAAVLWLVWGEAPAGPELPSASASAPSPPQPVAAASAEPDDGAEPDASAEPDDGAADAAEPSAEPPSPATSANPTAGPPPSWPSARPTAPTPPPPPPTTTATQPWKYRKDL